MLGRPFLATGATLIDAKNEELTLRVGDEKLYFNLNHNLKQPELSSIECETVQTEIPVSSELTIDCNF